MMQKIMAWARGVKTDVMALWIAVRDERTPRAAKFIAVAVVAYALSPIDLIPDFIPVLGYLDDLLIVPLGIILAVRLIPSCLMMEFREHARRRDRPPPSKAGAAIVVVLWAMAAVAAGLIVFSQPT